MSLAQSVKESFQNFLVRAPQDPGRNLCVLIPDDSSRSYALFRQREYQLDMYPTPALRLSRRIPLTAQRLLMDKGYNSGDLIEEVIVFENIGDILKRIPEVTDYTNVCDVSRMKKMETKISLNGKKLIAKVSNPIYGFAYYVGRLSIPGVDNSQGVSIASLRRNISRRITGESIEELYLKSLLADPKSFRLDVEVIKEDIQLDGSVKAIRRMNAFAMVDNLENMKQFIQTNRKEKAVQ